MRAEPGLMMLWLLMAAEVALASHIEGDLGSWTEVQVAVPEGMGKKVWCLSAEDLTNDLDVYLSPNTSPYVSPDPTRVVVAK